MPLADRPAKTYTFNHVANAASLFTGLGMANPGASACEIRLEVYTREGQRTGSGSVTLGPAQRTSKLLKELVPESATQNGGIPLTPIGQKSTPAREIPGPVLSAVEKVIEIGIADDPRVPQKPHF